MRTRSRLVFGVALTAGFCCAYAQVITTVAGTDFTFPNTPLPAINAPTGSISGMAIDASGNLYVADNENKQVFQVNPKGILTVVAGNGTMGFGGDGGPATSAPLPGSFGVAVDVTGNLYIAENVESFDFFPSFRIRKVTPSGIISTVVGKGSNSVFSTQPPGMTVDVSGNLFIADGDNSRVVKVTPDGVMSTVAGYGAGFSGDGGPATGASLYQPAGVAFDAAGNLFIADFVNNRIRKVTPAGTISTIAGNGTPGYSGDGGPATIAALNLPGGVAVDAAGNLFIADSLNDRIRKVTPAGIISTIVGNGTHGYSGDGGPATIAALSHPLGVAVDAAGNLFIADSGNRRIRKVTPAGIISTVIGNGGYRFAGDGGPAAIAALNIPQGVVVDGAGNLFFADFGEPRIRKVSPNGVIRTVAGNGTFGYSGDGGPATSAMLAGPDGVAVDAAGNLFIADVGNNRIRKMTTDGVISTVAGSGTPGYSGDGGPATSAMLAGPNGVAVDAAGNLFIADNNRIRKVTSAGIINTVAGNGNPFYSGDGGPATSAGLFPSSLAVDAAGNLFIADLANDRIRKVTPAGTISTVAGNGKVGYTGDGGPAASAELNDPEGVAVDEVGDLFIADSLNYRIRKVTPAGTISTVAGNGKFGYTGDGGPATSAELELIFSNGVAVDAAGNLFIADSFNHRIRVVLATPPAVSLTPPQLQFSASSGGAPTAAQTLSLTSSVKGLAFSATIAEVVTWLRLNPFSGSSPRLIQVIADPTNLAPNIYQTAITVNTPNANPPTSTVAVTFTVAPGQPSTLTIDKPSLSFPFPQHGSARSQTIIVSNSGGGALKFTATASTAAGGPWLSVSPASGQALPASPATLAVTADPTGLSSGTYTGQVTVTTGTQSQSIPVTMTISMLDQAVLLSQTGLSFLGVSQGGVLPAQSFGVLNIGTGVVDWSVSTSTLSGGNWLQVTPSSGSTDASAASVPTVQVSVNAASLPPGEYYGLVRVDAPGAANTPQVLTVFVRVLAPDADIGAVLQPAELLFTATVEGESPGSQNLMVYNVGAAAKSFQSSVAADTGLSVVTLPTDATLDPQQPTRMVVQPFTSGLGAGVHTGVITLQFSDGRVLSANVRVIVSNAAAQSSTTSRSEKQSGRAADTGTACTATKLLPALATLGPSFAVSAGWPVALGVEVKDDCGAALESGAVTVNFSNGDKSVVLTPLKGGHWDGTWTTSNKTQAQVTLTLQAQNLQSTIRGQREVSGALQSQTDPPKFDQAHIVSAAGNQSYVALAPGSIISIYGDRLAESVLQAPSVPLPSELVDTEVRIGQKKLPLYYVGQGQLNAIVPSDLNVNTTHQVLVRRGLTYSQPVSVDVAAAQPAVFANGLFDYPADQSASYQVTETKPAKAGDTLAIFCAGLGLTKPRVADGAAAPSSPPAQTQNEVEVTIGGVSAPVAFAGLAPGFVGLYQLNVAVPSGVPSGNQPLVLRVSGQISSPATLAIR